VFGQIDTTVVNGIQNKKGTVRQVVPALTYTSDLGLIGAGMLASFNYGDGEMKPYYSYTRFLGALSTKGFASFGIVNDKINAFDTNWRILTISDVGRLFNNNYFGIGNDAEFNERLWADEGFNYFDSYNARLDITARYPIKKRIQKSDPLIDAYLRAQINFRKTEADVGSLLAFEKPKGFGNGFVNELGIGFIYDGRDNELIPTKGTRLDLEAGVATSAFGSDWNSQSLLLQLRHYVSIPIKIPTVLAFQYYHLQRFGDNPFWNKPALGGDTQLRGFVLNRFVGDGANLLSAEMRSWVYEPTGWPVKFGVQVFYEMGRVFDESQRPLNYLGLEASFIAPSTTRGYSSQSIFEEYHKTKGIGFSIGFPSSDLVVRGDYGLSDEISRFYIAVGYAF
jgi:outer membrane protein assembly factor BamA